MFAKMQSQRRSSDSFEFETRSQVTARVMEKTTARIQQLNELASKAHNEVDGLAIIEKHLKAHFEQQRQKWKETLSENSACGSNSRHEFSEANRHESSETVNNLEQLKTPQNVQASRHQFKYPPDFDHTRPSRYRFKIIPIVKDFVSKINKSQRRKKYLAWLKKPKHLNPPVKLDVYAVNEYKLYRRHWKRDRRRKHSKTLKMFHDTLVVNWGVKKRVKRLRKFLVEKFPFLERFKKHNPEIAVLTREMPELPYFL